MLLSKISDILEDVVVTDYDPIPIIASYADTRVRLRRIETSNHGRIKLS